jgi:alpha-L-fucosidase
LLVSRDVLVTRRDKTVYIHFNKGLTGNGFKLKPLNVLPEKAVLLNNGREIECVVDLSPGDHIEQKKYLRLRNLPANDLANGIMVAKLVFKNALL